MTTDGSAAYLRDAVMTATPEQLQLMLYDGAIRFATQGRDAILAKDHERIYDRFSRAQRIVLEMQSSLRPEVNPSLCAQMASLYNFIYRKLVDANIHRDLAACDDALKILQYQRETWVMLIEKLKAERAGLTSPSAPTAPPARTSSSSAGPDAEVESTLCVEG